MPVDNNSIETPVEEVDSAPAEPIEPDDDPDTQGESDLANILDKMDEPATPDPAKDDAPKEGAPAEEAPPEEPPAEPAEPLDEAAQALLAEAKEWADQIDPELEKVSPELYKRTLEHKVGLEKLVAKNKDQAKGFDLYRQMDEKLHSPEDAPVALASLVTYLTDHVGLDRATLLSELGVDASQAPVATPDAPAVDPDNYDFDDPNERSKYADDVQAHAAAMTEKAIEKAMSEMRAQFGPELEKMQAAHEATVAELRAGKEAEAINRAIPVVIKKLSEDYSGFQATPAEVREAQQSNPQAFQKDAVDATAKHLVKRLTAHAAQAAAKRTQPTDDLHQPDARVGVTEKDIKDRGLLDYIDSAPV